MAPTTSSRMQEADQDRQRHADEEHLHLRHQPRQHAEPEVEQEAEHQERRRQAGCRCGTAPATVLVTSLATSPMTGTSPGAKQRVAVVQRGDHEVMQVGGEDQRDAEHVRKLPTITPCWPCVGSTAVTKPSPSLLGDHRARDLQRRDRQPRGQAEHDADQELLAEQQQHRPERAQIELIVVAVQRQQHARSAPARW